MLMCGYIQIYIYMCVCSSLWRRLLNEVGTRCRPGLLIDPPFCVYVFFSVCESPRTGFCLRGFTVVQAVDVDLACVAVDVGEHMQNPLEICLDCPQSLFRRTPPHPRDAPRFPLALQLPQWRLTRRGTWRRLPRRR